MSYMRSSYKTSSSSYRFSSDDAGGTGTGSSRFGTSSISSSTSRFRSSALDDDSFGVSSSYSTRRSTNYEPSSSYARNYDDDLGISSSSRHRTSIQATSSRLTGSALDSDYDMLGDGATSTSRYKYKITSIADDDDDDDLVGSLSSSRKYSRNYSRDENEPPSSSSRFSRYSSMESSSIRDNRDDDDYNMATSTTTTRRRTKLSYLNENIDIDDDDNSSRYGRRSYQQSTSLGYDVKSPSVTDDTDNRFSSSYMDYNSGRRRSSQTSIQPSTPSTTINRSLSRMDSKDAQIYQVILDYKPPLSATDEISLKEGQEVIVLSKDKPHKWKVRTRKSAAHPRIEEGFAPSAYLKATTGKLELSEQESLKSYQSIADDDGSNANNNNNTNERAKSDLNKKIDMIIRELIETEEDLIRDMQFVVRTYIRTSESSITPNEIRSQKDKLFNCYKDILEFHKDNLLRNFQRFAKEPINIGKLFLKLQPEFVLHTRYCQNLSNALNLLDENSDIAEYFNNYSVKIRDEKPLSDRLKLPSQRLNDYQLLLKELSKNLSRLDEDVGDLEKSIKMISSIPDNPIDDDDNKENAAAAAAPAAPAASPQPTTITMDKQMDFNLPGDSSEKLHNLLKNVLQAKDFFDVIDADGTQRERFIFFFKSRMFITEINKNLSADQRTYNVEKIIKLPQVDISAEDANTLIIKSIDGKDKNYPIRLRCQDQERIKTWLDMINSLPKCEIDAVTQITFQPDKPLEEQKINIPIKLHSFDENNNKIPVENERVKFKDSRPPEPELEPEMKEEKPAEKRKATEEINEEPIKAKIVKPITVESQKSESEPAKQARKYSIIKDLKSSTKQIGDTATFHCQVSPGTTNVQWLKDNEILSGNNYRTYKKGDNYYLELNNLTIDDNGIYTFVASDSKTSVASSSTLNVLGGDSRPTSPGGSFLPHPPKFKVKLKDTDLLEGASCVRFELIVRGLPIPVVKIFKDGKPLQETDRVQVLFQSKEVFEIVLHNVCQSDAGVYRCVATNPEGQAETSGRITVTKNKDVFFGLDENAPIPMRDPHSPRCTSPAFKWFKDGKEFEASERFQVQFDDQEDTVALIFQHVTPDDAGLYTCVASTSSGKISCHAELNVQGVVQQLPREPVAPQVLKELSNVEVSKGQNVALLEAQIIGFPKPIISWYKEDRKIESSDHYKMMMEGEENVTLMIKNVNTDDVGKYRLVAENKLGKVETAASLSIVKQPEFCKALDRIEIDRKKPIEEQQLVIEQKYDAAPAPTTVKWEKDGQELPESKRIHKEIDEEKQVVRLVIDNITSEDAGQYTCSIANKLGQAKQQTQVLVKSAEPKFLKKFESLQVREHEKAIFTAQYNPDAGGIQILFFKNDRQLKLDERIQLKEDKDGQFSLIIDDALPDDEGKYKCKIKNDQGSDEADANLIVIKETSAPKFKDKLCDMQAQINDENIKLEVKVSGEPRPQVQWFHDGQLIEPNKPQELPFKIIEKDDTSTLLIPKVMAEHSGQYVCKSSNQEGQIESEAKLIVKHAPYVVKHLENINVNKIGEEEVRLSAIIKGVPTPDISWTCNDKKIIVNDGKKTEGHDEANCEYSLVIHKFEDSDCGEYRIAAKNPLGECESKSMVQLVSKPLFSKVLKNVLAKPMERNIEMVVRLDSKTIGKPIVKWFKDDVEIKDTDRNYKKIEDKLDHTYKLIVMEATDEMVGKYKCVVSNDFGSTETAAKFDLMIPPRFIKGLHDVDTTEGNNVSMTIQLAGFPQPEIKFYKDGEEISTSAHVVIRKEMDDIYQFEIENIRIIMSGEYECRIRNPAGEASSKGFISVNTKPQFLKDLNDQTISVGDDIQLEVTVTGQPSPQIKWFVNGKEAKGSEKILFDSREESYKMKVPNAQESDAGIYHCVALNKAGEQSSNKAEIKVEDKMQAPKIIKPIKDSAIVIDDNVRFETVVTGVPKPEVVWTKDSRPLTPNEKVIIKSEGDTHTLIMKNCQKPDSGIIGCEAKNVAGSIVQKAELEVEEPTIPTIEGLDDRIAVDGEPLKMNAKITGFPKPIVEWFHRDNKQPLSDEGSDNLSIICEPKRQNYGLDFKTFPSEMSGPYVCRATNSAGTVEKPFNVELGGKKPVFIKELDETQIVMSVDKQNNRLKLGQSAIFETIVDGIPTPDVQWLKNDKPLTPSPRILIESNEMEHRLEVKTISKEDVAKYTCKAVNKHGEAQTVCLLKFLNEPHEPIIKKPLEDVKVEETDNLTLFCKVDGEPMPAVRWLKDEKPIEDLLSKDDRVTLTSDKDGSTKLVIENVQKSDSGKYAVEAENAKGTAKTDADVKVVDLQRAPTFPQPLKELMQIDSNQPLVLEAKVFGIPKPKIEWLKDGKPLKIEKSSPRIQMSESDDGKCQLRIDQATPQDAGVYALKISNPTGEMLTKSKVEISPEPYAPLIVEDLPVKVQVQIGEPLKLSSKIQSHPPAKLQWMKDSKPLKNDDDRIKITEQNDQTCLSIDAAKPEDQGTYTLTATNPIGETAVSTKVEVVKPVDEEPMISKDKKQSEQLREQLPKSEELKLKETLPNQQQLVDGEDLHLKMQLATDDDKSIDKTKRTPLTADNVKIFKDNVPIQNQLTELKIDSDKGIIEFVHPKCSSEDSGLYRIEIQTPTSSTSNSCMVNVMSDKDQKSDKDVGGDKLKDEGDKMKKYPRLRFDRELSNVQVESGHPCRLECSLDMSSNEININDLSIAWFKDGEELLPGEHYGFVKEPNGTIALLIDSFVSKDIGDYQVKIMDKSGQTISSIGRATLKPVELKTKPEILDGLHDISVNDGDQLCLKCQIAPMPNEPITTKWLCNGKELQESDTVKFLKFPDGIIMLQMNKVSPADSGDYKVVISNKHGDATSSAKVSVMKPKQKVDEPKIRKALESTTLIAGQPGFIEFEVDLGKNDDSGDVRFLIDSKLITPDDRIHIQKLPDGVIRLKFDEVKLSDAGAYTGIFKNDGGQTETKCTVNVESKPIIITPLEDMAVKEKCSIKFETKIEANPEADIVWLRNGSKIQIDGKHYSTSKMNDKYYTLTINDCGHRDKAEYTVKATNKHGTAMSKANLDILYSTEYEECPPEFIEKLSDMSAGMGDTVQLKAKVKAHPVPKIVWKKDGQEIPMSSDRIISSFNGEDIELTILNFYKSDVGIYEVSVANALGQISSTARVVEHAMTKPEFIRKLSDLNAETGMNETKLTCRVRAYPMADIQWTFNGRLIDNCSKYSIQQDDRTGDQTLIIHQSTLADSGVYECIATNCIGFDKTSSNVLFSDKFGEAAHFITKLQDCDCKPGSTAQFNACVVGNPSPEFKWYKDDKEIKIDGIKYKFSINPNGMIQLEITDVNDNDLGRYRCMASNKYGSDNSIGQLNFETSMTEMTTGMDRMNQSHKSMKRIKDAANDLSFDQKMMGVPKALTEKPIITKMIDNSLTLLWFPSVPEQPRFPVSYVVEFSKISDGTWTVCHGNIKDCTCDITGLEPFEDYSFRVRVENKFGQSDPSPAATVLRSQLKDRDAEEKALKAGRKPDDYYLEHRPPEKVAAAPQFVRDEHDSMFGIIGQPVTIEFWVYGYPEPKITWFFGDKEIDSNDQRFKFLQDRNGKTCLFINRMTDMDAGLYTCVARNEHGEEKKTIKVVRADAPHFTKLLDETNVMARNHVHLKCSITSSPQATIKWFKDFQPLHDTSRLKIVGDMDNLSLTINDAILRDSGLYSCTATNIAGSTTTSAYVRVHDQKITYDKYPFSYKEAIKPKNKPMEQFYDIGDELGRGTQGITYHTVDRSTGKSYAVKMMYGTGEMRQYMNSELDIMNQLGAHENLVRLHDCFQSTPYSMSLIQSMSGGGSLLEYILKKGEISEKQVADYMKQILEGLHYMHFKNIGHLGLTINDILMERIDGNDITICDFGLAQRLTPGASVYVEFGHPEFVSPEIVDKNAVTLTTDTWSAGIVAYILLTGISPFLGENDRCTLQNIQNKKLDLSDEKLGHISEHGRDFLRKTLNYNPTERLDIKGALNHPWIKSSLHSSATHNLNIMDKLRSYKYESDKWYKNASCRRYYRRRELHSCYTHPSRMIYPPDEQYSPLMSPEREMKRFQRNVAPFENVYPPNQTFDSEPFSSESHYQCGPDTYLLQLRDTAFPARIRRYLKIAAANSPMMASNLQQAYWSRTSHVPVGTFSQPSIKERRKFTDIMDEEISDEMRGRPGRKPRRLAREIGTPLYLHGQLKTLKREAGITRKDPHVEEVSGGIKPFFREKLQDTSFQDDTKVVFTCYAIGVPAVSYTWFRNDSIVIETNRTKVKRLDDGRCQLILDPAKEYDCGVYRCVARNTLGSAVCRARLSLGDVPNNIAAPSIKDYSNHDVLLQWSTPKYVADAHVQQYRLEMKKSSSNEWSLIDANIRQEFYLVTGLQENESYHFRLIAKNKFGFSEPSPPSDIVTLSTSNESKTISLPYGMQFVCNEIIDNESIDYAQEQQPIQLIKSEFKELYDFKSVIAQGKFSVIARAYIKDGSKKTLACKCVLVQSESESSIVNEYEILKSLSHERIIRLMYANRDQNLFTLAMELCCGLNVLTYLCRKQTYNEQIIATILSQTIDAIQYLHFRNIVLIELQPDNILIVNENDLINIKLVDFGNARFIHQLLSSSSTSSASTSLTFSSISSASLNISANPEYIAPEIIRKDDLIVPYTDVWTIGVLAYILLSGHSPFKGQNQQETIENVLFVRYLFERLYTRVTQEAIRFLLAVFKLTPHKRPTLEECFENKWLLANEFMMKKRESATFDTQQIQAFTEQFMQEKCGASKHSRLLDLIGLNE